MNFPCSVIFSFFHLFQLIFEHKPRKGKQAAVYRHEKEQTVKPKVLKLINNLSDFVQ